MGYARIDRRVPMDDHDQIHDRRQKFRIKEEVTISQAKQAEPVISFSPCFLPIACFIMDGAKEG